MDPLSALSLTCNILAVVDFTWTLLTETREIYKSESGGSAQTEFVEDLAITITGLNDKLSKSRVQTPELEALVTQSQDLASELLRALDSVKVKGRHSKWKSFAVALREVWGKNGIKDLTDRLESLQRQITRHILASTSQQVHDTHEKVFEIAEAISKIESDLFRYRIEDTQYFKGLKDQLLQAVQKCVLLNDQHITDLRAAILEQVTQPIGKEKSIKEGSSSSQNVLRAAERFTGAAGLQWIYDDFLEATGFSRISSRYHNIVRAHGQTFDWIFKDSPLSDTLTNIKSTLREWLETDSKIYWLYGKPGSGKSTLMKYLCDNPKTKQHLQVWSGGKEVVIAQFYFWNSGNTLQKSQEGLLRSIIFEVLSKCPDLIPLVCDAVDGFTHFDRDDNSWTPDALLDMFKAMAHATHVNFCLFIDGLDEFIDQTRTHHDLLETLGVMCSSPHIKICVSSRPWTVFRDEFGDKAHLKLEDVTHNDIEQYVTDKFHQHAQFHVLMSRDPAYTHLVTQVVDRAQGVFLWVYLVVRTLLEGITYHDSLATLQRRLDAFPPDLESFFQVLIDSVSPIYHRHMSRYFAIATTSGEPQRALMYSFLDDVEDNAAFAMTLKRRETGYEELVHRMDQLRRRLDGRSRGLLELETFEPLKEREFLACKVNFLHRTLGDFLSDYHGIHETFKQRLGDEDPALTACYSILAVMKTAPFTNWDIYANSRPDPTMHDHIRDMFFFASASTMISNSETELLDIITEAESVCIALVEAQSVSTTQADSIELLHEEAWFLAMASVYDFFPYVERKLKGKNHLFKTEWTFVNSLHLTMALDQALNFKAKQPLQTAYMQQLHEERHGVANRVSCRCISLLLQAGADPNGVPQKYYGIPGGPVWSTYVFSLESISAADRDSVYKVVELLLNHGADWNAYVSNESVERRLVRVLGQELTAQLRDQYGGRNLRDNSIPVAPGDSIQVAPGDSVQVAPGDSIQVAPGDSVQVAPGDSIQVAPGDSVQVAPGDSIQVAPGDSIQVISENAKDTRHRFCDICCSM